MIVRCFISQIVTTWYCLHQQLISISGSCVNRMNFELDVKLSAGKVPRKSTVRFELITRMAFLCNSDSKIVNEQFEKCKYS